MRFRPIDSLGTRGVAVCAIVAMLALAGCGSDTPNNPNPNPGPGSTTYTGSVTGNTTSGTLSVTVATSSPAANPIGDGNRAHASYTATGTFTPAGGAAVALTGTYDNTDPNAKAFGVSGGGWTFSGGITTFGAEGGFTGPGGVNGLFSLITGSSSNVTVIVGTYGDGTSTTGRGIFNFSISGSEVHGNAWTTGDVTPFPLDGAFNSSNGHITIYTPGTTTPPYAGVGDLVGTTASGTWTNNEAPPDDEGGAWTGTKQ